jgi:hypothetical protein
LAQSDNTQFVYIRMSGDTTSLPGRVSTMAFEQIWKKRGFAIVDTGEAELALSSEAQILAEPTTSKKRS